MSRPIRTVHKVIVSLLLIGGSLFTIYRWLGVSNAIKLDDAFVIGRVIRLDAPMNGVVESVNLTRFSILEGGSTAFVVSGRDTANKVRTAEIAVRAALSEGGQSCMQLDRQTQRVRIADMSEKLADEFMTDTQRLAGSGYVSRHELEQQRIEQSKARIAHEMEVLEQRRLEMDVGEWTPGTGKLAAAIEQLRQAWLERSRSAVSLENDIFVYDIHVLPGQWVEEGTPLATVIPVEALRIQANTLESQISRVFVGQAAEVRVDGLGHDKVLHGHVETIVPATAATFSQIQRNTADSTWLKVSQRIPVVVQMDDAVPPGLISIGQSAEVRLLPGVKARTDAPSLGLTMPATPHPIIDRTNIERRIAIELKREHDDLIQHLHLPASCNLFKFETLERLPDDEDRGATVAR